MIHTMHRADALRASAAVPCEDSFGGCPECMRMKWDGIYQADMPRCSVCGFRSGLRVVRGGYECYTNHVWDD